MHVWNACRAAVYHDRIYHDTALRKGNLSLRRAQAARLRCGLLNRISTPRRKSSPACCTHRKDFQRIRRTSNLLNLQLIRRKFACERAANSVRTSGGLSSSLPDSRVIAQLLTKARILLKVDVSEAGDGWSDSRIAEALDTSVANIERTRQQLVTEGFEAALRKQS
jgi:hypothetical protein